mmetsp:Transcript_40347/g.96827  ORF Transcript_40347/g.96827 Transcript_40347/m.96827 type:complete len:440 (+) Transcript_40347:1141-2460(+)
MHMPDELVSALGSLDQPLGGRRIPEGLHGQAVVLRPLDGKMRQSDHARPRFQSWGAHKLPALENVIDLRVRRQQRLTHCQLHDQTSDSPHIHFSAIHGLPHQELRGPVPESLRLAARAVALLGVLRGATLNAGLQNARCSKISNQNPKSTLGILHKDVIGLQVPVEDQVSVHEAYALQNLTHGFAHHRLPQRHLVEAGQWAGLHARAEGHLHKRRHHVHTGAVNVGPELAHDVGVLGQSRQDGNLTITRRGYTIIQASVHTVQPHATEENWVGGSEKCGSVQNSLGPALHQLVHGPPQHVHQQPGLPHGAPEIQPHGVLLQMRPGGVDYGQACNNGLGLQKMTDLHCQHGVCQGPRAQIAHIRSWLLGRGVTSLLPGTATLFADRPGRPRRRQLRIPARLSPTGAEGRLGKRGGQRRFLPRVQGAGGTRHGDREPESAK